MDNSKLPKTTKKSSETPWTPTNELKKHSDRAGTVFSHHKHRRDRKWAGGAEGERAKKKAGNEDKGPWNVTRSTVREGKKKSGDPVSQNPWNLIDYPKGKDEEREY
jgi:hypothetical protein